LAQLAHLRAPVRLVRQHRELAQLAHLAQFSDRPQETYDFVEFFQENSRFFAFFE